MLKYCSHCPLPPNEPLSDRPSETFTTYKFFSVLVLNKIHFICQNYSRIMVKEGGISRNPIKAKQGMRLTWI